MDYIIYAPIGEKMESGYKTKDMKAEVKKEAEEKYSELTK